MKYTRKVMLLLAIMMLFVQTAALADDTTDSQTPPEQEAAPHDELANIAPDSLLYPVKLMIESITISLTTDETQKALLLVEYADRRIGESEIMQEADKAELAQKLLEASMNLLGQAALIAGETASDEGQTDPVMEEVLSAISELQEKIVISIEIMMDENADDEDIQKLMEQAEKEVVTTIVTKAFVATKDEFFNTKDAFAQARQEYKDAKESGDEDAINAAYEQLLAAEANKDAAEGVKDAYDQLKDDVKDCYEDEDEDEDEIEDEDQDEVEVETDEQVTEEDTNE